MPPFERNQNQTDDEFIVDDTSDDVMAAYRELQDRAEKGDLPEPEYDGAGPLPKAAARGEARDAEDRQQSDRNAGSREERDERGRFKPKSAKGASDEPRQPQTEKAVSEAPDGSEAPSENAPPPSWGVKAKAAWGNLPAEVRAEIGKREGEVAQGLAALRDYKDLKPYADEAARHGTTIAKALDHYAAVDRLLKQDLHGGMAVVANAFGVQKDGMGAFFAKLAEQHGYRFSGSQMPNPNGGADAGAEDDPLAAVLKPLLDPIMSELNALKSSSSQRAEADRSAQVQSLAQEIQRFAADPKNVYYSNVEKDVARIFELGLIEFSGNPAKDLQAAYEMAIWQNPETRAVLIEKQVAERQGTQRQQEQDAVRSAREASRSMGGSRVPGTVITRAGDDDDSDDVEADVRRALRQHQMA